MSATEIILFIMFVLQTVIANVAISTMNRLIKQRTRYIRCVSCRKLITKKPYLGGA